MYYYIAFYLGAGAMVYLLQQWRAAGDRVARNWLFVAFGSWAVAVIVGSSALTAGYIIAGLSLAIGLSGAAVVHFRRGREDQS